MEVTLPFNHLTNSGAKNTSPAVDRASSAPSAAPGEARLNPAVSAGDARFSPAVPAVAPAALILVVTALMTFGLVMIASATISLDRPLLGANFLRTPAGRQTVFVAVGLVLMGLTFRFSVWALASARICRWAPPILFAVTALLLMAAFLPGFADPRRGSSRWLSLSPVGLDFGVQPSELAKLALVAVLAWLVAGNNRLKPALPAGRGADPRSLKRVFLPAAVITGLCIGLVGKENLGTAVLLAAVAGLMLTVGGCNFLHLTALAGAGIAGLTGLLFAAPYRLQRIIAFQDIWADPQGKGYQPIQSLTSIASGGWLGVGLGAGIQKFGYLPESHTDFIFAIVCEETGLLGGGLVMMLFCAFAWMGMRIMLAAVTPFERMLAFGITMVVSLQAAMNIAVVTVSIPTTGVPLPMLSAGGSGLLTVCIGVGLLAAISERSRRAAAGRLGSGR